ncbi:unnamed protein product [Closterium sp. Yama58-4]|nr:unnamed protein product [Closterium sp. Yama58-4]
MSTLSTMSPDVARRPLLQLGTHVVPHSVLAAACVAICAAGTRHSIRNNLRAATNTSNPRTHCPATSPKCPPPALLLPLRSFVGALGVAMRTDGPVASPSLLRALHSTVESTQLSAPHASAPHPSGSAPHVSRSFSTAALSPLAAGLSTSAASSVPLPVQHGASTMRAAVMREVGAPLRVELLRIPRPQAGEVLIKTRACGVCHTDLHVMRGHVAFPAPCVLGHEVSGEVVDHGAGTDAATIARLPVGSRVVAAFIMPCGSCFFCTYGQEDICSTFFAFNRLHGTLYDGHTRLFSAHPSGDRMPAYLPGTLLLCMGGLADYCVAPASAVAPLPPALPLPEAAVMGCALFTAFGALRHAGDVRAGDTVAVVGAGGVGGSCVQVARAMGAASIVAVDVAEGKLQRCRALGATHTVNAAKEDVVEAIRPPWFTLLPLVYLMCVSRVPHLPHSLCQAITGSMGVDVAVEALGRAETFGQTVHAVRDGGRAVMVGIAAAGTTAAVDITRLVRRNIKIIGSYGAKARSDLPAVVALAAAGRVDVVSSVTERYCLEDADSAYCKLEKGNVLGRAIVDMTL